MAKRRAPNGSSSTPYDFALGANQPVMPDPRPTRSPYAPPRPTQQPSARATQRPSAAPASPSTAALPSASAAASPVAVAPGEAIDPSDPQYAAKMAAQQAAAIAANGGQTGSPGSAGTEPVVFWGSRMAPLEGGKNPQGRRHGVTTTTTMTETQALLDIYKWPPAKVQKEIAKLRAYGFDVQGNDLRALEPWWAKMVTASEQFAKVNKNVSPFDAPALMGSKAAGDALTASAGAQAKYTGAYSRTSSTSEVDNITSGDAQSILNASLSQHLGRAATPEEIQDFLSRANALAKADPKVTTRTTDYSAADPTTGMRTQNDRNTTVTGGFNANDASAEADKSANTPEAGAYEAAAYYAPMLFKALASPV